MNTESIKKSHGFKALLTMLLILPLFGGLAFLEKSVNHLEFIEADNPRLVEFNDIKSEFQASDTVLLSIETPEGGLFSGKGYAAITQLTAAAWQIPFASRVDSITNTALIDSANDELVIESLEQKYYGTFRAPGARVPIADQKKILTEPNLVNKLISDKYPITGVRITMDTTEATTKDFKDISVAINGIIEKFSTSYPDYNFGATGTVPLTIAFSDAVDSDVKTLYPIVFLVIFISCAIVFRSIKVAIATLVLAAISVCASMGLAGYLGIPITTVVAMVPIMVMVLAVADAVHLTEKYNLTYQLGHYSPSKAMKIAVNVMGKKIIWTSVATSIGFLSLMTLNSPPLGHFGGISAFGVMIACVLTIYVFPYMLSLLKYTVPNKKTVSSSFFTYLAEYTYKFNAAIVLIMGIFIGTTTYYAFQNVPNDQFLEYFPDDSDFITATNNINEKMTGIYDVQFQIKAESFGLDSITEPEILNKLEKFEQWLEAQPEVRHVEIITEYVRQLFKKLNNNDKSFYRIPDTRSESYQALFAYEINTQNGQSLDNLITIDKDKTRIVVTVNNLSSNQTKAFTYRAEAWAAENGIETMGVSGPVLFAHITEDNINSVLFSLIISLFIFSAGLYVLLRDWVLCAISLIPNLAPISMAFGAWYFHLSEISFAMAIVIGISFGIAIDATVHMVSTYKDALTKGETQQEAITTTLNDVGGALTKLTIIMLLGFGVLLFSNFHPNSGMAQLTNLTFSFGLLADFIMLPALLVFLTRKNLQRLLFTCLAIFGIINTANAQIVMSAQPLNQNDIETLVYNEIAQELTKIIGQPVVYERPKDWLEYVRRLQLGEFDIVIDQVPTAGWRLLNQNLFHRVVAKSNPTGFVVASLNGSHFESLESLKHKKICAPRSAIHYSRLKIIDEYKNPVTQPTFFPVNNDSSALRKLFSGKCNAAIINEISYQATEKGLLHPIKAYENIPAVAVTVTKKQPITVVNHIKEFFVSQSASVSRLNQLLTGKGGQFHTAESIELKPYSSLIFNYWNW